MKHPDITLFCVQVLFTSDLKAFATEKSAAVAPEPVKVRKTVIKRTIVETVEVRPEVTADLEEGLADRVKRRRRNRTTTGVSDGLPAAK